MLFRRDSALKGQYLISGGDVFVYFPPLTAHAPCLWKSVFWDVKMSWACAWGVTPKTNLMGKPLKQHPFGRTRRRDTRIQLIVRLILLREGEIDVAA
jgi:hypothetical protein